MNGSERWVWGAVIAGLITLFGWNLLATESMRATFPVMEERQSVTIEHLKAIDSRLDALQNQVRGLPQK